MISSSVIIENPLNRLPKNEIPSFISGRHILLPNGILLVFRVKDLSIHSPGSLTRKICSKTGRNTWVFLLAEMGGVNLPADLVTVSKSAGRMGVFLLADFLTGRFGSRFTKSASRFALPTFLPADFLTGRFGDSH